MSKKERFGYIFAICALTFVIALFVCLYLSGYLFASNISQVSSIPLGTTSNISLSKTQSAAISFDVSGGVLPNEKIPQKINVVNGGQKDLFVRAKAFIYMADSGMVDITLDTNENWIIQEDGYYYFNEPLPAFATVGLCSNLITNSEYSLANKQRYIINIVVEALDSEFDVSTIWSTSLDLKS